MSCGCDCGCCGGEASGMNPLSGKAFYPGEVLDFQDGGIVSRSILDSEGGSVTLFTFDAGQSLSEHKAPYDALVAGLEGEAVFTVGVKRGCDCVGNRDAFCVERHAHLRICAQFVDCRYFF